jgi:hypothetical protein
MPKRMLDDPYPGFEALHGAQPRFVLDEHPDGEFIAMQTPPKAHRQRAAVWNTRSRKIVWAPEDIDVMCWTTDGQEVLTLRNYYERRPEKHDIIVTPLQSEYTHFLERRSWPGRNLVGYCEVELPTGWVVELIPSPSGRHVCAAWNDQSEAGVELFYMAGNEIQQLRGRGYESKESHLLASPVFSPDGRYLVFMYTKYAWWSPDDPATSAVGGRCIVGWIVAGDVEACTYRSIETDKVLPRGWLPPDPDDFVDVKLSPPCFTDPDRFNVVLPTGEEQSFSASECRRLD